VARLGGACRAVGRLVSVGVRRLPPATAAAPPSAPAQRVAAVAVVGSLFAAPPGADVPVTVLDLPVDGGPRPEAVIAGLGGDNGPTDVSTLAAISIGVMLLALTAFAVNALAGARVGVEGRRLSFRGARGGDGGHGDAVAIAALAVALAGWGALTLWVLLSGG
jgi:hypothetical protein